MELDLNELGKPAEKRGRGRPRKHADNAAKQAAYRERNGLVPFHVDLPADVVQGLEEYLKFKGLTKNEVIAKLIRTQLLRKR